MNSRTSLHRLLLAMSLIITSGRFCDSAEQNEKKITFDDHIKPIFREHCTVCHSETDKESDLAVDSYSATLAGGSSGEVVTEGNASASRLFALVSHAERPFMPPDSDPIPKEQIELLKIWIDQGMPENSGSKIKRSSGAALAMLGSVTLGKPDGAPPMPENILTQPVRETERAAAVAAMAASPWAPLIAVGGWQQVVLYHAQTGDLLGVIPFPEGEPQVVSFTRDGKQLLIAGGRHSVSGCAVLVDVATGERIAKVGDELDIVLAADISPDKRRIALAGPQKVVRLFDVLTGELVVEMKKHTDWIFALRYSPDGILLASSDRSSGLIVWEADTGTLYSELAGHKGEVRSIDFRPDSNVLASGSLDGTIKLWDMYESKEIKSWAAHGGGVTAVAYSHAGQIASAGRDKQVKLWDAAGTQQKKFTGLGDAALEVAITGDGAVVAGGDLTGKIQFWQADDPKSMKLVVSNPPSIQRRLASARELIADSDQKFETTRAEANRLEQENKEVQARLAEFKQHADSMNEQLSSSVAEQQQEEQAVMQLDRQIADLEQRLREAKQSRMALAEKRAAGAAHLVELTRQAEQSQQKLNQVSQQAAAVASQLKEATQALTLAQAEQESAKAAEAKLVAEQRALEKRAQELRAAEKAASERLTETGQQLASAKARQARQAESVSQISSRLASLEKQLAELVKQVQGSKTAVQSEQNRLNQLQATTQQLQTQMDQAAGAAAEASAKLQLFQRAYKTPQ